MSPSFPEDLGFSPWELARNASIREGSEPSSTHILWFRGRLLTCCTSPLGQRIDTRTGPLTSPKPKNTSLLCWERNPDPTCTLRVCRPASVSTVIEAPIASRLLSPPRRRIASDGGRPLITFFKTRSCGPLRFFRKTSSRPY